MEKDEETIFDCNVKIDEILREIKKSEINCFCRERMMIITFILKFTQELEAQKVKIGPTCLEECILNGLIKKKI